MASKVAVKPTGAELELPGKRFVPCEKLSTLSMDAIDKLIDDVLEVLQDLQRQTADLKSELDGIERFGLKNASRCIQIRIQLGEISKKRGCFREYLEQLRVHYHGLERLDKVS